MRIEEILSQHDAISYRVEKENNSLNIFSNEMTSFFGSF